MKIMYQLKKIIQFILIEMLYKKFAIEIVQEQEFDTNIKLISSNTYDNHIQMDLATNKDYFNVIRYVDNQGIISDYPTIYDTYNEAFNKLSTYYYNLKGNGNIQTLKIVEVYDDLTPPLEVLRAMKIKKLLD